MILRIILLASLGYHPIARRPRVNPVEAGALSLALALAGAEIEIVHAGPAGPGTALLRDLLGMGTCRATLLETGADADVAEPLLAYLRGAAPDLILAGHRAETGEGSGMLPYFLAEALGRPLVSAATALSREASDVTVVQALSGGRRRKLVAPLPAIVTLDTKGPGPRLSAFGRARRAQIESIPADGRADNRQGWTTRTARARPKRLSGPKGLEDAPRAAQGRQLLEGLDPDQAAAAIITFLEREGLFEAGSPQPEKSLVHE